MKLRDYIQMHYATIADFASELGYSREHITNIVNNTRAPSRIMAADIEKFTKGEVTRMELLYPEDYQ